MTDSIQTPIVGAHFRPPAKALLACLPAGHPLYLRPQPDNEYDENAVQVLLRSTTIPTDEFLCDELETQLSGQGFSLEDVREADEWHLGFLPKAAKGNPALEEWQIGVQKAIHEVCQPLTADDEDVVDSNNKIVACTLSFDSAGKPVVVIPWPPQATNSPE